jgi:Lar family restriction alleviation protein
MAERLVPDPPQMKLPHHLLPCPFCGSENILDDIFIRDGAKVACRDCWAAVHAFQPSANDKAIEKWNRRAKQ